MIKPPGRRQGFTLHAAPKLEDPVDRDVGAIDFVVKPFDRDVLLSKVSRRLMP